MTSDLRNTLKFEPNINYRWWWWYVVAVVVVVVCGGGLWFCM